VVVEEDTSDEGSPFKEVTQDSASCSDSSFYEEEEMKSSRNKKEIMMPRICPGLMMSRINRYEADLPIWRHFMPRGRSMPMGSSILRKSSMHRKKRFTSFLSPAGMSLTKLPLPGIIQLRPGRVW
jgi:hypothetical protein